MKICKIVLFVVFLLNTVYGQIEYIHQKSDSIIIVDNVRIAIPLKNGVVGAITEAIKLNNIIYICQTKDPAMNNLFLINLNSLLINNLADNYVDYGNSLLKVNDKVFSYFNGKLFVSNNNNISEIMNIKADRGYSISPQLKTIIYSNFRDNENMFVGKLNNSHEDTLYCVKYSDVDYAKDSAKYYMGNTTDICWLSESRICYGNSDKGLVFYDFITKTFSRHFPGQYFEGPVALKNNKLLLISKTNDTDKYGIHLLDVNKMKMQCVYESGSMILDLKWADSNNVICLEKKGDIKEINKISLTERRISKIIRITSKSENLCLLK